MIKNIGFVATRFAGNDGVSLEAESKRSINPILASQADYEILAGPASWD